MSKRPHNGLPSLEPVAGNGLLNRRALLGRGIVFVIGFLLVLASSRSFSIAVRAVSFSMSPMR